jgi:hypothetical protein
VAAIYWPQVIPYRLPHSGNAVELRQITLPRAAIVSAVSTFRQAAEAVGATSLHMARQRLPRDYEAMLDLVEVTVAAQPLPGSRPSVRPIQPSRSSTTWTGARARRSPRRACAVTDSRALRSGYVPAPAMN